MQAIDTSPTPGAIAAIAPKRPTGPGWRRLAPAPALQQFGYPNARWLHTTSGMLAISAVEVAKPLPGELSLGPEYHLSVSHLGARCGSAEALWVLGQFDLTDATEDNHVPSGRVRNYWRPVADRLSGYECPCQDSEPAIREDKGDFVWRAAPR